MNAKTDQPWLKSYPKGMHWDASIDLTPVQQILDDAVARWPDQPAINFMGRQISYLELGELTDRGAKGLQQLGVGPGVHVGIYLPNSPHTIIAFFSILKAGGTVVNYSPLDAAKVLEHKIDDSRTDLLFTLDLAALYPNMVAMLGKTRLKKLIIGNVGEMASNANAVNAGLQGAKQLADAKWDDQHVRFADLLDNDGKYQRHPVADPKEQIAVLQYTGGTTGLPKGAMLTHANLTAACSQFLLSTQYDPPIIEEGKERYLGVLPPFHIYALTVNMLFALKMGAEIYQHMRFDPKAAL